MMIVGEKINTSRKFIGQAVEKRDAAYIQKVAKQQIQGGATMLDVNAGTLVNQEPEALVWLIESVQAVTDMPLCLDSPNPAALEAGLKVAKGEVMINSITAEKERYDSILPFILKYNCKIVGLLMDDGGMPEDTEGRMRIATNLVGNLTAAGVPVANIYLDPLVRPVSTGSHYGKVVLDTISGVMAKFPGIHTICGLSNVSFGLPVRKLLNQAFMVQAMAAGLDGVIVDPTDQQLMALLIASNALLGRDDFCMEYIMAARENRLEAPAEKK